MIRRRTCLEDGAHTPIVREGKKYIIIECKTCGTITYWWQKPSLWKE